MVFWSERMQSTRGHLAKTTSNSFCPKTVSKATLAIYYFTSSLNIFIGLKCFQQKVIIIFHRDAPLKSDGRSAQKKSESNLLRSGGNAIWRTNEVLYRSLSSAISHFFPKCSRQFTSEFLSLYFVVNFFRKR